MYFLLLAATVTSCGTTPSLDSKILQEEVKLTAQYTPVYSWSCTRSSWQSQCTFAPDGGYTNLKSVFARCGDDQFNGICQTDSVGAYIVITTVDNRNGLQ